MFQQLLNQVNRLVWLVLFALVIILGGQVWSGQAAGTRSTVIPQVFDVNCTSLATINSTYAKLMDLGSFTVQSSDSIVELTFNGRIFVSSFTSGSGAIFELRVDNAASTVGRARANLRSAQAGGGGVQTSITGLFTGLAAGTHTASMWVRTSTGGAANQAMLDPGCWSTDVLIVKEYVPFGFTYLPMVVAP
jgi:hypothetical protein